MEVAPESEIGYGKAGFDRTHNLAINYIYRLPRAFGRWNNSFGRLVFDVPFRGSLVALYVITLAFIVANLGLGRLFEAQAEALAKVRSERPDLVTLDITMPTKTGVTVYRDIKENEEFKNIPVLIVTGVQPEFRKFISTRRQVPPPEGYLEKPVALADVLAEVQRLIGQAERPATAPA